MAAPKLQRWIDLLAALLRRQFHVTFEEIVHDVPAYQRAPSKAALRRTFERDKDELRAFGVPIQTVESDGEVVGYRLSARDFYLPYLGVITEGKTSRPRKVERDGYRALTELAFEPDELEAVVEAARRVEALGDPLLAGHVRSAMRKLAADLPVDAGIMRVESVGMAPMMAAPPAGAEVFETLNEGLAGRKRLTFRYHSLSSDTDDVRVVEPLGLFFVSQQWYVAARDTADAQIKNFRVSRMSGVQVNERAPGKPDFDRPAGFKLREHARSRQAWELGSGGELEAIVEFVTPGGAAQAAARLGAPVAGEPAQRRFHVRRVDAFVRWLLSLGDSARPVGPPALLTEYQRQARETLDLYGASR
jgi:proteasome accessory factor B